MIIGKLTLLFEINVYMFLLSYQNSHPDTHHITYQESTLCNIISIPPW